jgi:hypothetical protein
MKELPWHWKESHALFCQFIKWVIKLTVLIIKSYHCFSFRPDVIEHSSLKTNFICRLNYLDCLWILTRHINYKSDILHSSDSGEQIWVQ